MTSWEHKAIDVARDFELCLNFREDAYRLSLNTLAGFETMVGKEGCEYRQQLLDRQGDPRYLNSHVTVKNEIVGQVEMRNFSDLPGYGYLHLIYLVPAFRQIGLGYELHQWVVQWMKQQQCRGILLSAGRKNFRAIEFYQKLGWTRGLPNPKHSDTDFYKLDF